MHYIRRVKSSFVQGAVRARVVVLDRRNRRDEREI